MPNNPLPSDEPQMPDGPLDRRRPPAPEESPGHDAAHRRDVPHDGCQQVLEELERFIDAECDSDLERSIRRHLSDCPPCLNRADFQVELKALIARKCSQAAPSGLIDRVVASLRAAGGGLESSNGRWGGA